MLLAGIGQASIGHTMLEKAGLFERPTNYTSLAFADPQALPEQLTQKQSNIDISFTISNVGEPYHGYQWSMHLVQAGHPRRVATGAAKVMPGKGVTITKSAKISCTHGEVQVTVSLTRPAETISAWMACPTQKAEEDKPAGKDVR